MSGISVPSPKKEYVHTFPALTGGLNLWELDYRLDSRESPRMENLMWREGTLNCRDGQVRIGETENGDCHAAYEKLYQGRIIAHLGEKLCSLDPDSGEASELLSGLGNEGGSFFLYGEALYYKCPGSYIRIFTGENGLEADSVTPYTPITVINASPEDGSGELYQPENRISAAKTVWYNAAEGVTVYHLPVKGIDSIVSVSVDGVTLAEGEYSADLAAGTVTFLTAPPVYDPPRNNSVTVSYEKSDPEAYASVMDCRRAITCGGTGALCVVMGGCSAQPNAYFWNGNHVAMDAGYFPLPQYQLAGSADNAVTGFGRQQSYLIIFQQRSVGRSGVSTQEIDGRVYIDMPYTEINSAIGCDLPDTVQTVENNLVWASRDGGVYMLRDTTAALENNIICISRKINGSAVREGLLHDLAYPAVSVEDGERYLLCANGHIWAWDHSISSPSDPSWFYWTGIHAAAFIREGETLRHLDSRGRLTAFEAVYADYGQPIRKLYRFAPRNFGSLERLKNVNSVLISSRSDTNALVRLRYITDYEEREDRTPLKTMNWLLIPRNMSFRSLRGRGFAEVFRRRPMCRHVRHFTMELENNELGHDLSVVSAQIFYNYQGKQR